MTNKASKFFSNLGFRDVAYIVGLALNFLGWYVFFWPGGFITTGLLLFWSSSWRLRP